MLSRYELEVRRLQPHYFARAASVVVGPYDGCDYPITLDYANVVLAIEAAWTYVASLGGGEVVVMESDYGDSGDQIDSQGSNVVLRGMGYGSFLRTSGTNHVINITHDFTTVQALRIAQESVGNDNDGINFGGGLNHIHFISLWITDSDRAGIMWESTNTNYVRIEECYITGTDSFGIGFVKFAAGNYIRYSVIANNIINTTGSSAMHLWDVTSIVVEGNILIDTTADKGISGVIDFSTVCGNIFYNPNTTGIYNESGEVTVFSKNTFFSPGVDGIRLYDCTQNVVSDNMIYDPADDGIELADSDYCSCLGNTIYASGDDGIIFDAVAAMNLFTCVGNIIIHSDGYGISQASFGAINRAIINNNFVYNSSEGGIIWRGTGATSSGIISGNYVYSSGWDGIYAVSGNAFLIINNYSISNALNGILVAWTPDSSYVAFNYCIDNGTYGITLDNDTNDCVIYGNYTRANTSGCMRVDQADCDDNIIWTNSFDEGAIADAGTGTCAFDNYDPSANNWIASIAAPAGGR